MPGAMSEQTAKLCGELAEGTHFGLMTAALPTLGSVPPKVAVRVQYNGTMRDVWVYDAGLRPPHPQGIWLDDLVNTACRRLFGSAKGSARAVQGQDYLEFRDFWEDPVTYRIDQRVNVERVYAPDKPPAANVCRVRMTAFPGADEEALILARAGQECERHWGPGEAKYVAGRTDRIVFTPMAVSAMSGLVPCRYTVHRAGGKSHDLVIRIPISSVANWPAISYSLTIACRTKFGAGELSYAPELGEVHFYWK